MSSTNFYVNKISFVVILIFLQVAHKVFANDEAPITVEIEDGILIGTTYKTINGRILTAFLGIPYAAAPVNERRFMAPQKLEPWTGVYKATTLPNACMQYTDVSYTIIGEEDCLYLNVFMPRQPQNGNELLDVLVFIHGGAFMFGVGHTKFPDYIMRSKDIVYVSLNYRLGILGFMSTGDPLLPGNNGLKDQAAALKWVKKNIAKFGGNPYNITLSGSSAGGVSVHYHMLSNTSNGLFNKGISFSGSIMLPWALPRNNTEKSLYVAKLAGCPTEPIQSLITCLNQRRARQIVEFAKYFTTWQYEPFTAFGPTIEPENPDSFLTEHPTHLLKSGRMKDLPFLVSLCKNEGLYRATSYFSDKEAIKRLENEWNLIAPHMFMYNYSVSNEEEKSRVSEAIKKFYFGDEPVSEKTARQLTQAYGDRAFYNGIVKAMKIQAAKYTQDVHCYKFSYRGKYSMTNRVSKNYDNYGVSHADDVAYLVMYMDSNMTETTSDAAMAEFLANIVTHFMKYGDTKFDGQNNWEPVSRNVEDKFRCLEIHSSIEYNMVDFKDERAMKFWEDLLPRENTE